MKIVIVSEWWFSTIRLIGLLILCLLSLKSIASDKAVDNEQKQVLRIAVASNFYHTAKILAEDFEHAYGVKVKLTTGSSGLLANQIAQGAPFDVFFSADEDKVKKLLIMFSMAELNSSIYAMGQLMLVYEKSSGASSCQQTVQINDLMRRDEKPNSPIRVLIANPALAPYGAAAEYYMKSMNVEDDGLNFQFVYGNNVAQLAQMFTHGAAKYAWLSASQKAILESQKNDYCFFIVPIDAYPPIKQAMLVLHPEKKSASQFQIFLSSELAQRRIKESAYVIP